MIRTAPVRRHGFTLVELLVVIGIIALLISILLPSLSKARQQAVSAKCLSILKQLANANMMYAAENNGCFVPYYVGWQLNNPPWPPNPPPASFPYTWPFQPPFDKNQIWFMMPGFRAALNLKPIADPSVGPPYGGYNDTGQQRYPIGLICPNAIHAMPGGVSPPDAKWGYYIGRSYGMNITHSTNGMSLTQIPTIYSFPSTPRLWKQSQVISAASKIMFIDCNDYWARIDMAGRWEFYGEQYWGQPAPGAPSATGVINYRHNQGANMVMYDGHAEWKHKHEMYDPTNPTLSPLNSYGDGYWGYPKHWNVGQRCE